MSATRTPPLERRDLATRPADLPGLRAALEAHLACRPEQPQPYEPHTDAGWAYFRARCDWSDKRRRIEHEIWKLEHPPLVFKRVDRVPQAYRQPSPWLRR